MIYLSSFEIEKAKHVTKRPNYSYRGQDTKPPSIEDTSFCAFAKEAMEYTGDKMIGIATLHKSNAVPVFSTEDAQAIANMRR
jgi:carbonic anhydrase